MWKAVLVGTAAFAIVGTSFVYAQQRNGPPDHPQRGQFSQEDRAAFAAARIAALRAGLALSADQEKTWPAFETALKDLAKYRAERRVARRNETPSDDPTERLRRAADTLSGYGAALKKLADAQEPLYSSLDQAQKRRFAILAHMMEHGHHGWRHGRDHGRGPGRDQGGFRGGPGERPGMGPGMRPGMGPGMRPGMDRGMMQRGDNERRGEFRDEGRRDFGGGRNDRRFGRDDAPPRLDAPETAGEGDSL